MQYLKITTDAIEPDIDCHYSYVLKQWLAISVDYANESDRVGLGDSKQAAIDDLLKLRE